MDLAERPTASPSGMLDPAAAVAATVAATGAAAEAAAEVAAVAAAAAAVAAGIPATAALLMTGTTPVAPTTGAVDERLPVTLVAPGVAVDSMPEVTLMALGVAVERTPAEAMLLAPTVAEGKPPIDGTNKVGVGRETGGKIEGEIVIPNFDCIFPIKISLGIEPAMYETK